MSYQFEHTEPLQQALQRVALERVDRALEALSGDHGTVEGVHEARKRFKEIRALLRLVRAPLGETFKAENRLFRDLGRQLSAARDAEAMVETFDRLVERCPKGLKKGQPVPARAALEQQLESAAEAVPGAVGSVCESLRQARDRIERWRIAPAGFEGVAQGLRRSYRDGRRRLAAAYEQRTDEAFHEWRKRIKDHWYHTMLLREVWAPAMDVRKDQLKALSDLVGDDHDLAVLRHAVTANPVMLGEESAGLRVADLAWQWQSELRAQAQPLGRRLYAEKPGGFENRMAVYWSVWSGVAS